MKSYVIYKVKGKNLEHFAYSTASSKQAALNKVAIKNKLNRSDLKAEYVLIPTGEHFTHFKIKK